MTCTKYGSNKFWQCDVLDNRYDVSYGAIGGRVTHQTKFFDSYEEAMKEMEKKIKSKTKNNYYEIIDLN